MSDSIDFVEQNSAQPAETLRRLQELASQQLTARISYRKPAEDWCTQREVEPYSLTYSGQNLIVLTWQLDPVLDGEAWRNFRIDRIVSVANGGHEFTPRTSVTLHLGEMTPFVFDETRSRLAAESKPSAPETYFRCIERAMLDGVMTNTEISEARELGRLLRKPELKAIHAQVLANLLNEVAMDGKLTAREEEQLRNMRFFLQELGRCP